MQKCRIMAAGMEDDEEEFAIANATQNLKITLVPDLSIKAGLNGEDFDGSLTEDIAEWFQTYKLMWNTHNKSPITINSLKSAYLVHENPLLLALQLFANCPDCNNIKHKNSLAGFLLTTLHELSKMNPNISKDCTDDIRMVAFNFIKNSDNVKIYTAVTNTFHLRDSKEMFIKKIYELIDEHMYKSAVYWTVNLNLTNVFTIFDMVVPLILQDKASIAEEYLQVAVDQRRETIQFLDTLLNRSKTIMEHCKPLIAKYNYTEISPQTLQSRTFTKSVGRLARKYNIPSEITPNLNQSKSMAYIHFLLNKKNNKEAINNESWRELIKDSATNLELQREVIITLSCRRDPQEAAYWFRFFNYPFSELPICVQGALRYYFENKKFGKYRYVRSPKKSNNLRYEYHQLTLNEDKIVIVDTNYKMENMMKELENVQMVGFDSEWKPSATNINPVSLLQLAISDKIFLVDCISSNITEPYWEKLGISFFNNVEVLKLGFSLENDMSMLQRSIPGLCLNLAITSSYLDLQFLWRKLKMIPSFKFPFDQVGPIKEGLSNLVTICLGKGLDKSNQLSDWTNRPLRKEQVFYAALDAYCLIEIYKVIEHQLNFNKCNSIENITESIMTEMNASVFNQSKKEKNVSAN